MSKARRKWTSYTRRLFGTWGVSLDQPLLFEELSSSPNRSSNPSVSFYPMLLLAAAVATLGLMANSAALIIGAMIIAPLMNPIISTSYAMVTGDSTLLKRSFITLVSGIVLVIAVSFIIATVLGTRLQGTEVMARSKPTVASPNADGPSAIADWPKMRHVRAPADSVILRFIMAENWRLRWSS